MIVSRTPLRVSFVGGGTDVPAFYREHGGAVISASINKYVYVAVNTKFDGRIRVSYSKTEDAASVDEVEHPIVRSALRRTGISDSIEIESRQSSCLLRKPDTAARPSSFMYSIMRLSFSNSLGK